MTKKQGQRHKGGKFTILLSAEEREKLAKGAKRENMSATTLLRRFIASLAAVMLIACGGNDFESDQGTGGGAGTPAGAAGHGTDTGGKGGGAGAGGSASVVDGGQSCNGSSVLCADGFFCDPATRRCIEPLGSGGEGGGASVPLYGDCDGIDLVCESVGYCDGAHCLPKKNGGAPCATDESCGSGLCIMDLCAAD